MRFKAGPHLCHATDGERWLMLDRPATPRQVDFLYELLDRHEQSPDDVAAVECSEGGVTFEPVGIEWGRDDTHEVES